MYCFLEWTLSYFCNSDVVLFETMTAITIKKYLTEAVAI